MKRSILMLLAIAVALIFFGCEKEKILPLESGMDDQETTALKAAKGHNKFEGICTLVFLEPENTWYDATDDWRTTGTTIWKQAADGFYGTSTLEVDPDNRYNPDMKTGLWEIIWEGTVIPKLDEAGIQIGLDIVAKARGQGVSGDVKNMKAKWIYTMDYTFANPETFVYAIEGKINDGPVKRQGPK